MTLPVSGWIGETPMLFSYDGDTIFCAADDSIQCYAVATGERLYELTGHSGRVRGIVAYPAKPKTHIVSVDSTGDLRLWDVSEAVCVKTIKLKGAASAICAGTYRKCNSSTKHTVFVAIKQAPAPGTPTSKGKFVVLSINMQTEGMKTRLKRLKQCHALVANQSGHFVAISTGKTVYVSSLSKSRFKLHTKKAVLRLAFHPSKKTLALGDDTGCIRLWKDFNKGTGAAPDSAVLTSNQYHWHAHAVSGLTFTLDGGTLLSVGEESVLVTWQLETMSKHFLPRLGGPLSGLALSRDEKVIAIADKWNAIRIIDLITNKISRSITGLYALRPPLLPGKTAPAEFRFHRPVADPLYPGTVMSSAQPGWLQTYDIAGGKGHRLHCFQKSNRVSRANKTPISGERVELFTIRPDGQRLATLTQRAVKSILGFPGDTLLRQRLSFWSRSDADGFWKLQTTVLKPHDGEIADLRVCPTTGLIASLGKTDGTIKLWEEHEVELAPTPKALAKKKGQRADARLVAKWKCRNVGLFGGARDFVSLDFSTDGGCLAVATVHDIGLWDPLEFSCRRVLNLGEDTKVKLVRFIPRSTLLLIWTDHTVACVDLGQPGDAPVDPPPKLWTIRTSTAPESTDDESEEENKCQSGELTDLATHPWLPRVVIALKTESGPVLRLMGASSSEPLAPDYPIDHAPTPGTLAFVELPRLEVGASGFLDNRLSVVFAARSKGDPRASTLFLVKDLETAPPETPVTPEPAPASRPNDESPKRASPTRSKKGKKSKKKRKRAEGSPESAKKKKRRRSEKAITRKKE